MTFSDPLTHPVDNRAEEIMDHILSQELPRDQWDQKAVSCNWFTPASIREEVWRRIEELIAEIDLTTEPAEPGGEGK